MCNIELAESKTDKQNDKDSSRLNGGREIQVCYTQLDTHVCVVIAAVSDDNYRDSYQLWVSLEIKDTALCALFVQPRHTRSPIHIIVYLALIQSPL